MMSLLLICIPVLDQAKPNIVLTSSKADDLFIDALREYGQPILALSAHTFTKMIVDRSGSVFQIRPYKDFIPSKGRNRLFSLQLLSDLPSADTGDANSSGIGSDTSRTRDAYEFMSRRRDQEGDPTMKRWNAAIRLSNFASIDSSPLCVGGIVSYRMRNIHNLQIVSIYWGVARPSRSRTSS